ncbi:MAG: TIGR01777 family oxidoreductase [Planctomycetes bacterium]|nr:TIGR01777 family oxidoreductase [Planctomycetota bacterium]
MITLVTGSTGLIGSVVADALRGAGHEVYRLIRPPRQAGADEILWDPMEGSIDKSKLGGCDAVIHLAGESIAGRWTAAKRKRIYDSRVKGSRLLCEYIAGMDSRPKVFISASGVGYYGDRGETLLTEEAPAGEGFLTKVACDWEAACRKAGEFGVRTVQTRFGMVLSKDGGALSKMLPAFKLNLGGPLGGGKQYMPWVSIDDVVSVIMFALENDTIAGPVNVVSPQTVTNREFSRALARTLHRGCFFRVPEFVLKLIFGDMGRELLLFSNRAVPQKLLDAGFEFKHPDLAEALAAVLGS